MNEVCGDNRFVIIKYAKQRLIKATNIESCPEEMAVLDNILFRLWQMGWLPGCKHSERTTTRNGKFKTKYGNRVPLCEYCGYSIEDKRYNFCPNCGAKVMANE